MRWVLPFLGPLMLLMPLCITPAWAQPPLFEQVPPSVAAPSWAPQFDQAPTAPASSSDDGELRLLWSPQDVANRVYVLDPSRRRLVGFGGVEQSTFGRSRQVWTLSLACGGWSQLLAGAAGEAAPAVRELHCMTYDPVRDRVILFAGRDPYGTKNDVWALSLSGPPHWDSVATIGTPPKARTSASAIYDPVRDRIVYFGGLDGEPNDLYSNEIWELSLASNPAVWTLRSAQGPYPQFRYGQFAAYDAANDRMLMYGTSPYLVPDGDVWELRFSPTPAWHVIPSSTPGPSPTESPRMVYDASRNRLLLLRDDLWEFSLSPDPHWTPLLASGLGPPDHVVPPVLDPLGDRIIHPIGPGAYQWSLGGAPAWTPLAGTPTTPPSRYNHSDALDGQHRMWVFGGLTYAGSGQLDLSDAWSLDLEGAHQWSATSASGPAPPGRRGNVLAYDATGNQLLVFGGVSNGPTGTVFRNDLWSLSLTGPPAWTPLAPSGPTPAPRAGAAAFYDPIGNRLVMFGGYDGSQRNDLWELRLGSSPPIWAPVAAACPCPPVPDYLSPRGVYDPVRHRMLVYLGSTSGPDVVWELTLQPGYAWNQMSPSGATPNLDTPGLAYDPQRDRVVAWSGPYYWALSLGTTPPAWTELNPTGPRPYYEYTGVLDAPRDRLVMFGGYGYGTPQAETWTLNWGSPLDAPAPAHPVAMVLEPCRPNPASDRVTLAYTVAAAAPVRLEVIDVTGRRLATLVDGVMPAGRHEVRWDLTAVSGHRVAPGVYLYRLRSAGVERVRRLVSLK